MREAVRAKRVVFDALFDNIANSGAEAPKHLWLPLADVSEVLQLARERLEQLEAPQSPRNGGGFLTILDGQIFAAHDRCLINENALSTVLQELLEGRPLTLDALATVFGVETIFNLSAFLPPLSAAVVEDLAAAISRKLREEGIKS